MEIAWRLAKSASCAGQKAPGFFWLAVSGKSPGGVQGRAEKCGLEQCRIRRAPGSRLRANDIPISQSSDNEDRIPTAIPYHRFWLGPPPGFRKTTDQIPRKSLRPDLEGGSHGLLSLANMKPALLNLLARLVQFSLNLVFQFQAVFAVILKPGAKVVQFLGRQLRNGSFKFLHRAHGANNNTPKAPVKQERNAWAIRNRQSANELRQLEPSAELARKEAKA